MKSKKTIAVVLSVLMASGFTSNVFAEEANVKVKVLPSVTVVEGTAKESELKVNKEEAKNIAKNILSNYFDTTIDDAKYKSDVNLTQNYMDAMGGKGYLWRISWNYSDQEKNININVEVDASSGRVMSVNNGVYYKGQNASIATITEDKAREIGEAFLKKINPQEFSQCQAAKSNRYGVSLKRGVTGYNFSYSRMVNGIPFDENFLNVCVDSVSGQVTSYSARWNEINFPAASGDGVITADNAKQVFRDNLKPILRYVLSRDPQGKEAQTSTLKLIYNLDTSKGTKVDAKEGKMLGDNNSNLPVEKVKDLDEAGKKAFLESYKEVKKLDKEMERADAEKTMKGFVEELYGSGYALEDINYQDSNNGNGQSSNWSAQFTKKDAQNNSEVQGRIVINSLTGQLMSIYKYGPIQKQESSSQAANTWEQAYDRCIEAVKKYFPDKVKDIKTEQRHVEEAQDSARQIKDGENYNFRFNRVVNGLPYEEDGITVNFDVKTGEIREIYGNWTDNLKAPAVEGILSKEDAANIFFNSYTPKLSYTLVNTSKNPKNPVMEAKLVYNIEDSSGYGEIYNIDALTGKMVDYNGQEIDKSIDAFKEKIKGNPKEKELSILAQQGVIDTKTFELDKELTRTDLIKMLVNAKGYNTYMLDSAAPLKMNYSGAKGDETYKYLQMSVAYGILDNSENYTYNGDEKVTKEEMSKMLVKLLGYDKVAKSKNIFVLPYEDKSEIADENFGYVAISYGLGLTEDVDNKFQPKGIMTMKDAAVSIYKALDSLRNTGNIYK